MISVIVCSRKPPSWQEHIRNVAITIGCRHEYVRVDNTANALGICAAYNQGLTRAGGDVVVFVHEDVFFIEPGWGVRVQELFSRNPALGLAGVAGTQYLCADTPSWVAAGRPFIHGMVIHDMDGGNRSVLTVYSWERGEVETVAVDGLFMAIRASLFPSIGFDQTTFDGFHFYDLDICMQVRAQGYRVMVTDAVLLRHLSGGSYDHVWMEYARRFVGKYRQALPATCVDSVPVAGTAQRFESFDITDRIKGALACLGGCG